MGTSTDMTLRPGALLQEIAYPTYHLFVEEVTSTKVLVWHTFVNERPEFTIFTKNAGHVCWCGVDRIRKKFKVIGYVPGLLNQLSVKITP